MCRWNTFRRRIGAPVLAILLISVPFFLGFASATLGALAPPFGTVPEFLLELL
jgi:hypothetical protein